MRPDRPFSMRSILARLLLSVLSAVSLLAVATLGMFMTSAPAPVSLLLEPLSLLYMPGVLFGMALHLGKEVSSLQILVASLGVYVVFVFLWLSLRARRRGPRSLI